MPSCAAATSMSVLWCRARALQRQQQGSTVLPRARCTAPGDKCAWEPFDAKDGAMISVTATKSRCRAVVVDATTRRATVGRYRLGVGVQRAHGRQLRIVRQPPPRPISSAPLSQCCVVRRILERAE